MQGYGNSEEPVDNVGLWPLYVGLFLALLTFFIVLFGLSEPKSSRTSAVIESLQRTFARPAAPPEAEGLFVAGASALDELDGDLAGLVRIVQTERSPRGEELRVELAASELFPPSQAELRASSGELIDRIVAAVSSPPPGLRLQLSLAFGRRAPITGANGTERDVMLAVARCGTFARAMIERGVPPAAVIVGIEPGEPEHAGLTFRFSPLAAASHEMSMAAGR